MTMGQRRRSVRKSSMISEKQTAKKHEAAQRHLFQMSGIPPGLHKKQKRTASRKQRPAEGELCNTCVEAPDQPHVRSGRKNKLEKEKTLVNLKWGFDKELIQERRNANAGFVDLLILANSVELLESQGMHDVDRSLDANDRIDNKQAEKDASHDVDDSLDATNRICDAQVEKDALHDTDKSMDATDRIGNAKAEKNVLHDVDKSLDATDRIGNAQGEKDASHMNGRIHRVHFQHQAPMYSGLEIPRTTQEDHVGEEHEHADLKQVEDTNIDYGVKTDQVKGTMGIQENPDLCVATEKGHKGLEGVRKPASLVEVVTTDTKEVQLRVKRDKVIPLAVRMRANAGDSGEQSDACLRRNDRTSNMNGSLNENNLNPLQEHAPTNCQTEPSPTQMLDEVEPHSAAFCMEKLRRQMLIWRSESLAIKLAGLLKEGPSVARQLQPCLKRLTTDIGHPMRQSDAFLLRKDSSGSKNSPLNVNNLKFIQEHGHTPNCQTEPSLSQVSDAAGLLKEGPYVARQLQPCLKSDKTSPEAVRMTTEMGHPMEQSDACLQRKDSSGNKNSPLNVNNLNSIQKNGHTPNCQTEPSLSQVSDAAGLLKEGPSVARQLKPCLKSDKTSPEAVRMTTEIGRPMDQSDACLQRKDSSGNKNSPLNVNNLNSIQKNGHTPNCQTEPSLSQVSDAVKGSYHVAHDKEKLKQPLVIQKSAWKHGPRKKYRKRFPLTTVQLSELSKEGPSAAREKRMLRTSIRRKQRSEIPQSGLKTALTFRPILPRPAQISSEHGDCMEQGNANRTSNMNGLLSEDNSKLPQEHGHAPPNCQIEPSLNRILDTVKDGNPVAHSGEKWEQPLVIIQKSELLKHGLPIQLAESLKEGPSVAQEKRMLQISERSEQHSKSPPIVLQTGVAFHSVLPRPEQITPEHGDCMEQGDVTCQLAEDTVAKLNGSLQENNLNTQQECVRAPLCEMEPSRMHLSEALESPGSVVLNGEKQKRPTVNHIPQSLDRSIIAHHRQMLRSVDQYALPRQKTNRNEMHENAGSKSFEGSRNDKFVEAQQVQGAHLQDTQDIRKEASEPDVVKVTNEKSVPSEIHQLTKDTCATNCCQLKGINFNTQHGWEQDSLNCGIIPSLILTSDPCVVPTRMPTPAFVVKHKLRREKRKRSGDEDLVVRRERPPKRTPIVQLPETQKDKVSIARHRRMLRTLERRKQRYGVEFRATADLHWSQTNNAHNWWMWHLVNSQKYEQSHIAKHHSSIYLPYQEMEKQFRVAAQEKEFRENSCMAAAREKQLKKLKAQRAARAARESVNNPQPTNTDTGPNKDGELQQQSIEPTNIQPVVQSNMAAMEPTDIQRTEPTDIQPMAPTNMAAVEPTDIQPMEQADIQLMEPSNIAAPESSNMAAMEATNIQPMELTDIAAGTEKDGELQEQSTNEEAKFVERKSQLPRVKHEARLKSIKTVEKKDTGKKLRRQKDKGNDKPVRRSGRLLLLQQGM